MRSSLERIDINIFCRTGPDKATLFYMVFACTSMTVAQQHKFGVTRHTQDGEELMFTDFYHSSGTEAPPLGRKTDDETEARAIFKLFKGQKDVRLGRNLL